MRSVTGRIDSLIAVTSIRRDLSLANSLLVVRGTAVRVGSWGAACVVVFLSVSELEVCVVRG